MNFLGNLWHSIIFVAVLLLGVIMGFGLLAASGAPSVVFIFGLIAIVILSGKAAGYVACMPMLRAMRRAGWPRVVPGKHFTELFARFPIATWRCLPSYEEVLAIPQLLTSARPMPVVDFGTGSEDIKRLWAVMCILHGTRSQRRSGLLARIAGKLTGTG